MERMKEERKKETINTEINKAKMQKTEGKRRNNDEEIEGEKKEEMMKK